MIWLAVLFLWAMVCIALGVWLRARHRGQQVPSARVYFPAVDAVSPGPLPTGVHDTPPGEVDGVTMSRTGTRVLLAHETLPQHRGIYTVQADGTWTRDDFYLEAGFVWVRRGHQGAGSCWHVQFLTPGECWVQPSTATLWGGPPDSMWSDQGWKPSTEQVTTLSGHDLYDVPLPEDGGYMLRLHARDGKTVTYAHVLVAAHTVALNLERLVTNTTRDAPRVSVAPQGKAIRVKVPDAQKVYVATWLT
jgi:hypothetical protein